ncbi:MAG TPA: right-handed parallel beta-helix repeat-containing protein [Ktedonobacteraceae bacterium]|nr:right-handed parallel beta-helix repeat-containing protein [Ktedonobacteraceae bacterium]
MRRVWRPRRLPQRGRKLPSVLSWLGLISLALLLMTLLAACGGSPAPQGPTVSAIDNAFSPLELHINAGQTVTWVNNGQTTHTVTADDHSFDSGDFDSGQTYKHTFTQPGRYPYFCQLHGATGGVGMAGVIVVGNASSTGSTGTLATAAQPGKAPAAIIRVPEDYPTIQGAVKVAQPFDMISIAPGIYHEAVIVRTPNLTIRGRDRNGVILDGNFNLDDGFEVLADGVVLENMTARHFKGNGFYWTGVKGFRGSYLTAYADGDYGIYAYGSNTGQFDHDLAAGHPDSGFYIGYCHPCHAIISHVISEDNALGYSGTNAGGDLVIRDSIWRNNMSGIAPNTLDSEPNPPEYDTTIMNNLIENNNNYHAPAKVLEYSSIGNGIVIGGGNGNHITNNRINGHIYYGILIVPNIDQHFWEPSGNVTENNVITNSGVADLALSALSAGNNCFSNNTVSRTAPPFLQFTHACGSLTARAGGGDPSVMTVLLNHFIQANLGRFSPNDWRKASAPATQAGMPDPTINPQGIFSPIEGTPLDMTVAATTISPGVTLAGLGLATPIFEIILGFYMYYLPLALYATLLSVATWDIVRRGELKGGPRIGWLAVVYLIPLLGPLAYYLFGKSEIPRLTRYVLAIGVPVVYLLISVVLLLLVS